MIVLVFAKSPIKLFWYWLNSPSCHIYLVCSFNMILPISDKLSAVVFLQIPPGSLFDWAESSNGLGLDWHHSQSFQLDLCWRYLCSYIHPEVLERVRKSKEAPYEWSRPPLPHTEMKRNNHESLNNWEIHHKESLLEDTPGVYVQK